MSDCAKYGSGQIKAQVSEVSEPVVDVISEHIQKVHISEYMADTAVEKCVSYKLPEERICRREHITVCPSLKGVLSADIGYKKDEHVDNNQCVIRIRRPPRPNVCSDWKQHILFL